MATLETLIPATVGGNSANSMRVAIRAAASAKNFVTDFGGVGDGATDNSAAWVAFGAFGRSETAAGRGVSLVVPPGLYKHNGMTTFLCLIGISNLYISGYGASIYNTYNIDNNFNFCQPFFLQSIPQVDGTWGLLIATTLPNDLTVTLLTTAEISNFAAGDWVLVASLDIQFFGYPVNPDQFEFKQILTVNVGTGVITFNSYDPIRYNHRADFPDGDDFNKVGKARIWPLNRNYIANTNTNVFDVTHVYEGLTIQRGASNPSYFTSTGKHIKFLNCTTPGISPSIVDRFEFIGSNTVADSEPDKIVSTIVVDKCQIRASSGAFGFQSSSNRVVTCRDSDIDVLNTGAAQHVTADNCRIGTMDEIAGLGMNRGTQVSNCVIFNVNDKWGKVFADAYDVTATGSSYANGTITMTAAYAGGAGLYCPVPGQHVNLHAKGPAGNGDFFSGQIGTGIVTRCYNDGSNNIVIETTLPYATMPAWANGKVQFQRLGTISVTDSTGSNEVRQASRACAKGLNPWEYYDMEWSGKCTQAGYFSGVFYGELIRVVINVIQAKTGGAGVLDLSPLAYSLDGSTDLGGFTFRTDVTTAGIRDYTRSGLTGKQAGDLVQLNGVNITQLPDNLNPGATNDYTFDYDPTGLALNTLPYVQVEFYFDTGNFRTLVPVQFDRPASTDLVAYIVGTAP